MFHVAHNMSSCVKTEARFFAKSWTFTIFSGDEGFFCSQCTVLMFLVLFTDISKGLLTILTNGMVKKLSWIIKVHLGV